MKKPTVLQVLPRLVTGGVERGTVEVAAALQAAGYNAIVASAGGPMVEEIERTGALHVHLPLASKNPITMWQNVSRLAKIIRRYHVDIIHARSRAPAWSAYLAARKTGAHFVTTFHNAYGGGNFFKRLYNSVMAKGERVIAISDFVADHAAKTYHVPREILRPIPRGVDVQRFDPARIDAARVEHLRQAWGLDAAQPVILLPGRLTRWKGQIIFIDALAQLKRSDIACVIVGSGGAEYRQELANAIQQNGLQSVVKLVDECRDMPAAFYLADIVVSASTRPEGFGRVIVEAQAMGCLVVATAHGGAMESVRHGETGWLVPPNDAEKLAANLEKILALTNEQRKKISEQSMAHVRAHFTTAQMTARTLAVYDEVMASE